MTSRLLYLINPTTIDEETLAVAKLHAMHLEITDMPYDHACGHHALAAYLNQRGVPLVERFTKDGQAKYDGFVRQKFALQLQEREWIANIGKYSDRIYAGLVCDSLAISRPFKLIYHIVDTFSHKSRRPVCSVLPRCREEAVCPHRI